MSVSRGYFLKRFLINKTTRPDYLRFVVSSLIFLGLFSAFAFSTQLNWPGMAALLTWSEKSPTDQSGLLDQSSNGRGSFRAARSNVLSYDPAQGCTLNCTATVPATGQSNAPVSFQSTATPSGCATQPVFEWNFGDGTTHSNQQNISHTYTAAGTYNWSLTTSVNTGTTMVDTVAGGAGEGNQATKAPFGDLVAIARDTQGRGFYVAGTISGLTLIRFINTSGSAVTIAGQTIAPGIVRAIAGGGQGLSDNTPALESDLGTVSGMAVSGNGNLLYFSAKTDQKVRLINVSASAITVAGNLVGAASIGTLASGFGSEMRDLAVNPTTGDVYVADATQGVNKIFKVNSNGDVTTFAGNGASTKSSDPFTPGQATDTPLLVPHAIKIEANGNVAISDTLHNRVIRVDSGGNATLVRQFDTGNTFPTGLAVQGGNIYSANGNQQTVTRVTTSLTVVAGTPGASCDYSTNNCGDGGAGTLARLNLYGSSSGNVAAIDADSSGLYILDQSVESKGRVRYLNLSGGTVTINGLAIPAGAIDTIAGFGLASPYDGALATSATFRTPVGVAADQNGNLWIADTGDSNLRFVNRGASPITIFPNTPSAQVVAAGTVATVNYQFGSGPADGGPVSQAGFVSPQGLFITSQGIYVADSSAGPAVPPGQFNRRRSSLIRFINTTAGNVTLFPGSGSPIVVPAGQIAKIAGGSEGAGGNGDNGFALNAVFIGASDLVVGSNGTIYVTDVGQKAVRKIDGNTGVVTSLGLAQSQYTGIGLGPDGRLYIANYDGNSVLRENTANSGAFSVLASNLTKPRDIAVGSDGTAYVTVSPAVGSNGNHQIVQVSGAGTATVIAGSSPGFSGDGGNASSAKIDIKPPNLVVGTIAGNELPQTVNIIVGSNGDILFTDANNNRVRRLSPAMTTCVKTGTIAISGNNPAPTLSSISPNSALQGSGAFTLTVNGNGFVPSSKVRWGGSDRTTIYVSGTQLTAAIPASDLLNAGSFNVSVFNPTPGGGTSGNLPFTVTAPNPVPTLTSLNPNQANENGPAFTLTLTGTNFVNGSVVKWDGGDRPTNFVSSTQLTATIPSTDLIGAGQANVEVFNPTPGGGLSNAVKFTIKAAESPVPTLTSLTPNSTTTGGPDFTLNVTGTNFVVSSKIRWNGQERPTVLVSATQMQAAIPAADIATAGTAQITVFTPAPGGGVTAPLTFTITAPQQATLTGLNPGAVGVGGGPFSLEVTGTNFVNGATVRVNNSGRTTTFISSTKLNATISASDVAQVGELSLTVVNPSTNPSNALKLIVGPFSSFSAASYAASASPDSIVAGFGVNLATGTQVAQSLPLPTSLLGTSVKVKDSAGTERDAPLFFVAGAQINYLVPTGTAEGTATVDVILNNLTVGRGQLLINKITPSLFSANANGVGVGAAVALRVRGTVQTFEPIFTYDANTGVNVPVQVDLGPETDQVYLLLFGTGFRSNTGLNGVNVKIGGFDVPVLFAGPSPDYVGLDQCNVGPIPRSLIGKGVSNIVMTVDTKLANQIQITFK